MLTTSCRRGGSDIISPGMRTGNEVAATNVQAILECLTEASIEDGRSDHSPDRTKDCLRRRSKFTGDTFGAGIFVDNPCNGKGKCGKM